MQRNPSHFGSNSQVASAPSGSSGIDRDSFASIGASGGCTGRFHGPSAVSPAGPPAARGDVDIHLSLVDLPTRADSH